MHYILYQMRINFLYYLQDPGGGGGGGRGRGKVNIFGLADY